MGLRLWRKRNPNPANSDTATRRRQVGCDLRPTSGGWLQL
jgi:hypothetical protein